MQRIRRNHHTRNIVRKSSKIEVAIEAEGGNGGSGGAGGISSGGNGGRPECGNGGSSTGGAGGAGGNSGAILAEQPGAVALVTQAVAVAQAALAAQAELPASDVLQLEAWPTVTAELVLQGGVGGNNLGLGRKCWRWLCLCSGVLMQQLQPVRLVQEATLTVGNAVAGGAGGIGLGGFGGDGGLAVGGDGGAGGFPAQNLEAVPTLILVATAW